MPIKSRLRLGVLGGTFDPVHHGHLRSALELYETLGLDRLHLVPCHYPSHRGAPLATPAQRLAMLQSAIEGCAGLVADDCEIRRGGVSYSIDTLRSLREEAGPDAALCLILGADAFVGLPGWKEWQRLRDYAHIVVMRRPGSQLHLADELKALVSAHALPAAALGEQPSGGVIMLEQTQLAISSSHIRALCASGRSPRFLLPDSVIDYLLKHHIYAASAVSAGKLR
jgi:nicotinate-nucleotide adenylyltransferase